LLEKTIEFIGPGKIYKFSENNWADQFASILSNVVNDYIETTGSCNVMLTGGRSAETLYKVWASHPDFKRILNVNYYFGDERCVPPNHSQSNYGMAVQTLFRDGIQDGCTVHRIKAENEDREKAADNYASILPKSIDILLLSMGEDGHVASLFPHAAALSENERLVVPVKGPKLPLERLTITPPVIRLAKRLFILSCGEKKTELLEQLDKAPNNYFSLPARLALRGEWVTHS
jgi:6-phosphogluconolactonase